MDNYLDNRVEINVEVTPVLSLFKGLRFRYRLGDGAYGEWLVFEKGKPKYYFNAFDALYSEVIKNFEDQNDLETAVEKKIARK